VAGLPPVSTVFAAFLGYNPVQTLLRPTGILEQLPPHNVQVLTGREFFPHLISSPLHNGLVVVFLAAAAMALIAAIISVFRGAQYYHENQILEDA
jgi:hypothetical protein